jgi:hypothetical protein
MGITKIGYDTRENYVMRSFITCTVHQTLSWIPQTKETETVGA